MAQNSADPFGELYPLPAFHFKVTFSRFGSDADASFQDVSGISRELETEDVIEGGENGFVHHLPKAVKHQRLVLKRGIVPKQSPLVDWCSSVLEGELVSLIVPMGTVDVSLMNWNAVPVRTWTFINVYPVKWSVDALNSTKNEVAIETIELSYNAFKRG